VLQYPLNLLDEYAAEHEPAGSAATEVARRAGQNRWGFLAYDVLMRGLLAGGRVLPRRFGRRDIRRRDGRFQGAAFERHAAIAARLAEMARSAGLPPAALAIRAILRIPSVTSCVVGMRNPLQVEECTLASRSDLPEDLLQEVACLARY
jgi:aryl-alcohol dehydrogenase-like predicted oxidoreductase